MTSTKIVPPKSTALRCVLRQSDQAVGRRLAGVREIVLISVLYVSYTLTRLLSSDDLAAAQRTASVLLSFERGLHIDVEAWASATTAGLPGLAVACSYWYAVLHYVVTLVVLVMIYRRHPGDYGRARSGLILGSVLGLACFVLFPVAPPRLMPGGFTDVLAQYSAFGWWSDNASVPAGLGGLSNQLAAMPSLHVGWTLWVAWAVWNKVGTAGRCLAVFYLVGTATVVVATGNHWVVDATGGLLVMAIVCGAATLGQRHHDRTGR